MKQLIKTWTKTQYEIDPETGKNTNKVMTEIMSIYRLTKGSEVAEVETIYEREPLYVAETSNAKLFIEAPEMEGGITKKEYRALVAAALGKDDAKVDTAVFKAAYKIQRTIKSPSLFYSADYIGVAVEIYQNL
jgi:hypothetical protein